MAYTGRILLSLGRSQQIKDLKVALQCLFKIGSELLVEGLDDRLVLRSINAAKSAFFAVTFAANFFDEYQVNGSQVVQSAVLLKHVLATFRTHKIHQLTLDLDADQAVLVITVVGDNKITKTYHLECTNSEILNATIDKDSCPTQVIAEAGELNKLLSSFQSSLDEVTIIANPDDRASVASMHRACQLQSFYDPDKPRSAHSLHTSLAIDTRSLFVGYQHQRDIPTDVTFNVKDFRNMVTLCEHMGANIIIRFEDTGMPLVAEPYLQGACSDLTFRAELVLATLMESQLAAAIAHPAANGAQPSPLPNLQGQGQAPGPLAHPNFGGAAAGTGWDDAPTRGGRPMDVAAAHGHGEAAANQGLVRFSHGGAGYEAVRRGDETVGFEADDVEDRLVLEEAGAAQEDDNQVSPDPEQLPARPSPRPRLPSGMPVSHGAAPSTGLLGQQHGSWQEARPGLGGGPAQRPALSALQSVLSYSPAQAQQQQERLLQYAESVGKRSPLPRGLVTSGASASHGPCPSAAGLVQEAGSSGGGGFGDGVGSTAYRGPMGRTAMPAQLDIAASTTGAYRALSGAHAPAVSAGTSAFAGASVAGFAYASGQQSMGGMGGMGGGMGAVQHAARSGQEQRHTADDDDDSFADDDVLPATPSDDRGGDMPAGMIE